MFLETFVRSRWWNVSYWMTWWGPTLHQWFVLGCQFYLGSWWYADDGVRRIRWPVEVPLCISDSSLNASFLEEFVESRLWSSWYVDDSLRSHSASAICVSILKIGFFFWSSYWWSSLYVNQMPHPTLHQRKCLNAICIWQFVISRWWSSWFVEDSLSSHFVLIGVCDK